MALRPRPSALLWGLLVALGVALVVVRLRAPGSSALPWLTTALFLLLSLRVLTLLWDWRQARIPGSRLLLPLVILLEGLGLVLSGASQLALRLRLGTALLLEVLLLLLAVRAWRTARTLPGTWPEDRITAAFEAFVPPRAARLLALELVMLGSAMRFLLGGFRSPAPPGYSLHKETFLRAFLPVLPLLIPTDLFLIHALFPRMAPWLRWVLHVSTLYSVLWMVGLYATLRQRPHQLDGTQLNLHMGLLGSLHLSREQVVSAAALPEFQDDWAKRQYLKGMHKLLRTGAPAVELRLSEAVSRMGLLGPGSRKLDRVAVSVDDPSAFLAALGRPCA
ncbi:MAG: hypothetical protein IPP58_02475 [Holophagaceae bacterium]|uniref:Uncharacterized protein n=1 Tax=Candidatus Geothrix skivensis TaxID=2954439 RepID=A0A9D7SER4_9BACT|nr:hypothetical protein [Candidatus Geothrix skivensis]